MGEVEIELNVGDKLGPAALRAFLGATPMDREVDQQPLPHSARLGVLASIHVLRWYRRVISPHLGSRCVFEPSCSRYAELAIREFGFWSGVLKVLGRLRRCRPGAGGVDLPERVNL